MEPGEGYISDYRQISLFREIWVDLQQIRRAAVSIPSNVAEGQFRNSSKEFKQFLSIALGSSAELETQLIIAREIDYLSVEESTFLLTLIALAPKK